MMSHCRTYSPSFGAIIAIIFVRIDVASTDETEYRLIQDLMRNYDPRIRPSINASESLNVTFGLALAQIIDVDEKNQIITTNCWLNQVWIDYKLRWNPDKYGGIKVVRLPYDAIWKPDILLYNNADVSSYKSSISTNVIVTSDGNVTWLSMVIFRSSCAVDVKYFPFDEQNCTMLFASWTYDGFQLNLIKVGDDGDTSNYIPNSEWTLVKLHAVRNVVFYSCCAEPYPDVTYTIQMRRKPLFYVFNMILPCLLITLVALLGFYIPSDSGEKVTMGITTLLSMTVFLMLVAENMPPTSDVLPLVGLYYGITIAIVSLATAMTSFTLNIHHKGVNGQRVPEVVRTICFKFLAKLLCLRLSDSAYESKASVKAERGNYIRMNRTTEPWTQKNDERKSVLNFVLPRENDGRSFDMMDRSQRENGGGGIGGGVGGISGGAGVGGGLGVSGLYYPSSPSSIPSERPITANNSYRLNQNSTMNSPTPTPTPPTMIPNHGGGGAGPGVYTAEQYFIRTLEKVYQTIEKNKIRLAEQDRREAIKRDWQQVALVVDRLLLVVFMVATLSITSAILLHAPHSREFLFGPSTNDVVALSSTNHSLGGFTHSQQNDSEMTSSTDDAP